MSSVYCMILFTRSERKGMQSVEHTRGGGGGDGFIIFFVRSASEYEDRLG